MSMPVPNPPASFHLIARYRLLKDGESVYEQVSNPTYMHFLMSQLLPEHVWSIEVIEITAEEEIGKLENIIRRATKRHEYLEAVLNQGEEADV